MTFGVDDIRNSREDDGIAVDADIPGFISLMGNGYDRNVMIMRSLRRECHVGVPVALHYSVALIPQLIA